MAIATLNPAQVRAGRIAGALYLVTMATGVFGFAVRSSLFVSGDVTATAQNILAAEALFRVSIVTDMMTLSGVIMLAWGLYVLLRPVSRDLAVLGMSFRIAENAVLCGVTVAGLIALGSLESAVYQAAWEPGELHALARLVLSAYGHGYVLAFVFLGLGSTVFAWLLLKSGYVPKLLAGWGVGASLGLALGSCAIVVFPAASQLLQIASQAPMGVYEVGLGSWLLFRGPVLHRA
jgi:hypothetical protein